MLDIRLLEARSQEHVAEDAGRKVSEIHRGKSHHADHRAEGREGNRRQYQNPGHRQHRERRRGVTLDEGELGRTNHVNNQGLTPHGFDEPSGLEHGDIFGLNGFQLSTRIMRSEIVIQNSVGNESRAEDEIKEGVGRKVKD